MPYKSEKIIIKNTRHDRRIKLTDADRKEIFKSNLSQRELAKIYGVSRRLIQFVKNPEKYEYSKRLRREKGQMYYNKENHTKAIREHRQYKQSLYKKGEIKL